MKAEIIAIGTELLLGDVVNTNAAFIAKELSYLGIDVHHQTVVGDNESRLKDALSTAFERADIIITTGGLGPTFDDRSKETVADFLGLAMYFDEPSYQKIITVFGGIGRELTENNKKQAYIPVGATAIKNDNGTAPGIYLEHGKNSIIMLPGPPYELKPMFIDRVIPLLKKNVDHILLNHNIHIFGIGESKVEDVLGNIMKKSNNPSVAPYASMGELILRVTAYSESEKQAENMIKPVIKKIYNHIGDYIYGIDIGNLENAVVNLYNEKNLTLSVAESCTGGNIAKRITDVSGSSEIFGYGVVTYANEAKENLIGVKKETLKKYGAVSEEVAREMAEGIRRISGSHVGISTTGIAGPTGGTQEKPVGLVYVGVCSEKLTTVIKLDLNRSYGEQREFIRFVATSHALKLALDAGKKY